MPLPVRNMPISLQSYNTLFLYEADFKSALRDFKIEIIQGRKLTIDDKVYNNFIKSKIYKKFKSEIPNEIITGSTCLNLFGLLSREPGDLDVIISDDEVKKFGELYKPYYNTDDQSDNFLGQTWFESKSFSFFGLKETFKFDFFKKTGLEEIIQFGELKLQDPIEIINWKIKMVQSLGYKSEKNFMDLREILKF